MSSARRTSPSYLRTDARQNHRRCRAGREGHSAQDYLKGRYSEVDQINGYVAEESEKRGLKAPVNRMVTDITKRIHAGELKPDPANLKLIHEALGI